MKIIMKLLSIVLMTMILFSVTSLSETRDLQLGSTGTDVTTLQERLMDLGYLSSQDLSDVFDESTQEAMTDFQRANNLEETGTATATDQQILYSSEAIGSGTLYVVNRNSGKFHHENCPSVTRMKPGNKYMTYRDREDLISNGYDPCRKCNP